MKNKRFLGNCLLTIGKKWKGTREQGPPWETLLLRKHFHKGHILNKIFNKNTCKVSYSCMENMQSIIRRHNAKILKPNTVQSTKECNCRKIDHCPLEEKCLTSNIVYQAVVSAEGINNKHLSCSCKILSGDNRLAVSILLEITLDGRNKSP